MSNKNQMYGDIFDSESGDVDLKEYLDKKDVIYVDLDQIHNCDSKTREALLNRLIGNALEEQATAIRCEVEMLIGESEKTGKSLYALCKHNIKDEFHELGGGTYKCLVCGQTGSLE